MENAEIFTKMPKSDRFKIMPAGGFVFPSEINFEMRDLNYRFRVNAQNIEDGYSLLISHGMLRVDLFSPKAYEQIIKTGRLEENLGFKYGINPEFEWFKLAKELNKKLPVNEPTFNGSFALHLISIGEFEFNQEYKQKDDLVDLVLRDYKILKNGIIQYLHLYIK
jgi:hypothetical protein